MFDNEIMRSCQSRIKQIERTRLRTILCGGSAGLGLHPCWELPSGHSCRRQALRQRTAPHSRVAGASFALKCARGLW